METVIHDATRDAPTSCHALPVSATGGLGMTPASVAPHQTCPQPLPCEPAGAEPLPSQAGAHLAGCPDLVLEQLLSLLDPADLARAGRVCRRWYQISCRLGVQVRSIQSRYPSRHQRQLAQLDPALAHQQLALWYEQLPDSAPQRDSLGDLLHRALPAPALFCRLTQELLRSAQLSFHGGNLSLRCEPWDHGAVRYSPDGRWLVRETASRLSGPPALGLWRQEARTVCQVPPCPLASTARYENVVFSADSRSLCIINNAGVLHVWHCQDGAVWQLASPVKLCRAGIQRARFSPDGRALAVVQDSRVLLFAEGPGGLWQQHCCQPWTAQPYLPSPRLQDPDVMHFSDDSAHCLFIDGGRAFVFDDHADGWQVQELRPGASPGSSHPPSGSYGSYGLLAPRDHWLALTPNDDNGNSLQGLNFTLELWHKDGGGPWQLAWNRRCVSAGAGFTMAFSPDARQLVWPERLDNDKLGVCVLVRSGAAHWSLAARLVPGPALACSAASRSLDRLVFSAHGGYLAAVMPSGVQLWRSVPGAWTPAAWIPNSNGDAVSISFRFAPDGDHCALATGRLGNIRILGPCAGGYVTKLRLRQWERVEWLCFAPGGSPLVASSTLGYPYGRYASFYYLAPARPS